MPKIKKTKKVAVTAIDWETWAASGGTAGVFGKLFRQGKLKILPSGE